MNSLTPQPETSNMDNNQNHYIMSHGIPLHILETRSSTNNLDKFLANLDVGTCRAKRSDVPAYIERLHNAIRYAASCGETIKIIKRLDGSMYYRNCLGFETELPSFADMYITEGEQILDEWTGAFTLTGKRV